jgi:hypothetical protein
MGKSLLVLVVRAWAATEVHAALEVRGRSSGRTRSNPVVIVTVEGKGYLVSMFGAGSDWVKNVEAARGEAIIRHGAQSVRSPCSRAATAEGADPPGVRANSIERPTALPAPHRSTTAGF